MSLRRMLQTAVIVPICLLLVACSTGGPLVKPGPTIASGKLMRVPLPGTDMRMPGRKAVVRTMRGLSTLVAAGVPAAAAEQRISATLADVDVARLLKIEVSAPLIRLTESMAARRLWKNSSERYC